MNQTPKFHRPFSPTIMESTVPEQFVNIINDCVDPILSDDKKSIEWDWSHKLVGKVHKEIQIPISNEDDIVYTKNIMKSACISYVEELIKNNTAYGWKKIAGDAKPTIQNIHLTQSWVVSQYAGEFNPWHHHNGNFSAVIYLKLPPKMHDEIVEDNKDHYPASGLIEFMFGENQEFRSDNLKFKPEVGKLLVFPSWLKHFVYPFHVDGERRSMSFNAHMYVAE
jgi:uncharacterized protein (TIGR02466 family)